LSYAAMLVAAGRRDAKPRASSLLQRSHALARGAGLRGIAQLCRDLASHASLSLEPHLEPTAGDTDTRVS
jgi:hypothetical protein